MKKYLTNYYAIIMMILFIIYNLFLENLEISGFLYELIMSNLIIFNIIFLIKNRRDIKLSSLIIIIYFFTWPLSKNIFQCLFSLSSMIALISIGFMKSNFIKVISILITLFFATFFIPSLFIILLISKNGFNIKIRNDIYNDMHYYCDNNYEVYSYSAGAMDKFHYSIGKYYKFLDIDGIIYISYNERNEVTRGQYDEFLTNHDCSLANDTIN